MSRRSCTLVALMIPSPIPERKLFLREAVFEIIAFIVTILGAIITFASTRHSGVTPTEVQRLAMALYATDQTTELIKFAGTTPSSDPFPYFALLTTVIGLILLFWVKFIKARARDIELDEMKSPEGLRGCAHVLHGILEALTGDSDGTSLRITIFRISSDGTGTCLEQAIDYVGKSRSTGMARKFEVSQGIIGLAFRTKEAHIAAREDGDNNEYVKELIERWGYTVEQASRMDHSRLEFVAVPITSKSNEELLGIVYIDSKVKGSLEPHIEEIVAACGGFATYIEERFK